MYIYHAFINALSAHMIHINLNMIFDTHVKHKKKNKTKHKKKKKKNNNNNNNNKLFLIHASLAQLEFRSVSFVGLGGNRGTSTPQR